MTKEKQKKMVKAAVSAAVVFLFVLIYIMVTQLIMLGNRNREYNRLQTEITQLNQKLEESNDELESWSYRWKIEERARELGYRND